MSDLDFQPQDSDELTQQPALIVTTLNNISATPPRDIVGGLDVVASSDTDVQVIPETIDLDDNENNGDSSLSARVQRLRWTEKATSELLDI